MQVIKIRGPECKHCGAATLETGTRIPPANIWKNVRGVGPCLRESPMQGFIIYLCTRCNKLTKREVNIEWAYRLLNPETMTEACD
jgi:hypothetical protein